MSLRRGDIALAFYPFASVLAAVGGRCLSFRAMTTNQRIRNTIVAQITTNLARANDPAHVLVELATPEGRQSGLLHDSVVSCLNLATLTEDRIDKAIGSLPDATMTKVSQCLKTALAIS